VPSSFRTWTTGADITALGVRGDLTMYPRLALQRQRCSGLSIGIAFGRVRLGTKIANFANFANFANVRAHEPDVAPEIERQRAMLRRLQTRGLAVPLCAPEQVISER
jgi:hypothetical protein